MLPPLPRCSGWASSSLVSPNRVSLPRFHVRIGLHIVLFEACSAYRGRDGHYWPPPAQIRTPPTKASEFARDSLLEGDGFELPVPARDRSRHAAVQKTLGVARQPF